MLCLRRNVSERHQRHQCLGSHAAHLMYSLRTAALHHGHKQRDVGHLLGAAGAVEAIYSMKAIQTGVLPPTLNLENVSEPCQGIDLVPKVAKDKKVQVALSNSFGFGGTNASVIMRAV